MTENTRDKLIDTSIRVMAVKGFNNAGIAEILAEAQVPKGSFYHYFKSKDDLGLAIIDHYGETLSSGLQGYLDSTEGPALTKLRNYFSTFLTMFQGDFGLCNCLLGNLGQELSMQDATMRAAIFRHYRHIESVIAGCLDQAKAEGELSPSANTDVLAKLFFAGWQGCLARAKLEQSAQPLEEFLSLYFTVVLKHTA